MNITQDGEIRKNISSEKEVLCPTCHGKGTIPDPQYIGVVMGYVGRNGERFPHINCRTCAGQGWVIDSTKPTQP